MKEHKRGPRNGKASARDAKVDLAEDDRPTAAALHLSEARYHAIVADHPDLICRFLPDGTLTYVNAACCRFFGSSQEALLGSNFSNSDGRDRPAIASQKKNSLEPNSEPHYGAFLASWSVGYDHCGVAADGQICCQRWTSRAIRDRQGVVVEFQAVGQTLTEHKPPAESCWLERPDRPASATQITP
ncbi:MAG: PAS domain S-box protein [Leptolyngbyaceae cyanobacterium SU_3_3]|nr:PAS domain S-box protein [Leptolyngbyaceae cyanobacterium SU_3_3]